MANFEIRRKSFTNDKGDIVRYNVLAITGSIMGKVQTVEKSISNTEAMLIGMLLESDEELQVTNGGEAHEIEVKRKSKTDDIEQDLEELFS